MREMERREVVRRLVRKAVFILEEYLAGFGTEDAIKCFLRE